MEKEKKQDKMNEEERLKTTMNFLKEHIKVSRKEQIIPCANLNPSITGESHQRTFLAEPCNMAREVWSRDSDRSHGKC